MIQLKEKFGTWAIVTGASSGIGKEFAVQLANQGLNIILLARRGNLLEELSNNLRTKYNIQVKYMAMDLTDDNFIKNIEKLADKLDIGLVISNAGGARMGAFNKIPMIDFEAMIKLNVFAQMKISHWYTSRRIKENKKGGVLLVSSTAAYQGVPYAANYSAAKAYILNLGEALNFEYKNKGINITTLVPGPTNTPGLTENPDADMISNMPMKPQPVDQLVKEGISAILKNKPSYIGGRMNRIMAGIMKTLISRKRASAFWGKMTYKMVHIK
ncbi:SDR family NAD(P)-dependent oxidoreductase [Aquimarina sediminis]|uniref:SDR family NAD(P)-dependent oxidoreductase n=1 Tax=Aquimarina sediminis TaxID=2070536 RepID=UPI000CA078A3|nr:SDR family NAD(P)-dependent oxidoreductase [Aquimarina sediminis]